MQAAPPALVFALLFLAPLFFALPICLITAEMSTAFPVNGGYVVWVSQAVGPWLGGHNAYWVWMLNAIDVSMYPLLAAGYVSEQVPIGLAGERSSSVALILLVTCVNLVGVDWIVRFNTVLFAASLVPCLIFIAAGVPGAVAKPEELVVVDGEMDWAVSLSWTLWLYSGFCHSARWRESWRTPNDTAGRHGDPDPNGGAAELAALCGVARGQQRPNTVGRRFLRRRGGAADGPVARGHVHRWSDWLHDRPLHRADRGGGALAGLLL